MSIVSIMTDPAVSRPRNGSPSVALGAGSLGAGYRARRQAMWQQPAFTAGLGAETTMHPIFTAVDAAKPGGPPRGVFR